MELVVDAAVAPRSGNRDAAKALIDDAVIEAVVVDEFFFGFTFSDFFDDAFLDDVVVDDFIEDPIVPLVELVASFIPRSEFLLLLRACC